VINDLTSIDVGHDSWHGACAHLRQRRASRTAAFSPPLSVLGLMSVHHLFHRPLAHPSTTPAVSCTYYIMQTNEHENSFTNNSGGYNNNIVPSSYLYNILYRYCQLNVQYYNILAKPETKFFTYDFTKIV